MNAAFSSFLFPLQHLTNDGGGLDGMDDLLQCLDMGMLVGKLLLLMVQVATALKNNTTSLKVMDCTLQEQHLYVLWIANVKS